MTDAFFAIILGAAAAPGGKPNGGTSLVDAAGLRGWIVERDEPACVRNEAATLIIGECAGWVRTNAPVVGEYSLSFEIRRRGTAEVRALLGVLGVDNARRRPDVVIAMPLLGVPSEAKPASIRMRLLPVSEDARTEATKPVDQWQAYVVTRNRSSIHAQLNGTEILSGGAVRASDGWIGFRAEAGEFEVRNVQLHRSPASNGGAPR